MAGFSVFMTIVRYGTVCLVAACIASVCFLFFARLVVPEHRPDRQRVIGSSAAVPFFALILLVGVLLVHVVISNLLAHQDCGLSGDPYVTLPNGYKLGSANTYDGYIEAPGFKSDVPTEGPGCVRGIIHLQYSNGYFVGTHFVFPDSKVKTFVYDTRTRGFQSNDGEDAAAWVESVSGIHYEAGSYWDLYSQYRKTWPNRVLLLMIIASEGVLGVWWLRVWIG